MNTHHVPLRQMIYTKRQIKWNHENRSRKSPKTCRNFQGQHYEHKPHFDYQVESVDKEHETQIVRSSRYGMLCLVSNLARDPVEGVQFTPSCVVETPSQFTSNSFREETCSLVGEVWSGTWRELESKSKDIWQDLVETRTVNLEITCLQWSGFSNEITWSTLTILVVKIIRTLMLGVERNQELFRRRAQRQQVDVRDLGLVL